MRRKHERGRRAERKEKMMRRLDKEGKVTDVENNGMIHLRE